MKKFLFISVIVLFFGLAPHVFAQSGFVPLAPIPGLTDTGAINAIKTDGLASFFNNLYKFLIGLAAIIAVVMIIWGGLEISTQDSISKQGAGREKIQNAILGLILILSPVLVFSIINPSILNLSLNLPKIDLTSSGSGSGGGPMATTTGSGPACNGLINTGRNCTQTVFVGGEGTYKSPPPGAWCYKLAIPDDDKGYNCYRNQNGCIQGCGTTCGSYLAPTTCPAVQTTCNTACVVGI